MEIARAAGRNFSAGGQGPRRGGTDLTRGGNDLHSTVSPPVPPLNWKPWVFKLLCIIVSDIQAIVFNSA